MFWSTEGFDIRVVGVAIGEVARVDGAGDGCASSFEDSEFSVLFEVLLFEFCKKSKMPVPECIFGDVGLAGFSGFV